MHAHKVHLCIKRVLCATGEPSACLQAFGFVSHVTGFHAQFTHMHILVQVWLCHWVYKSLPGCGCIGVCMREDSCVPAGYAYKVIRVQGDMNIHAGVCICV